MANGTAVRCVLLLGGLGLGPAPCGGAGEVAGAHSGAQATRAERLVAIHVAPRGDVAMLAGRKGGRPGALDERSLLLLDLETGGVARRYQGDYPDGIGEWSPDGRSFATARRGQRGARHVGCLNVRSGEWTGLQRVGYYGWPHWTPDGTRIVFETRGGRVAWDPYQVHEVSIGGRDARVVANGSLRYCWRPFLGEALVFRSTATSGELAAGPRRYRYYALAQRTPTAAELQGVALLHRGAARASSVHDQYELLPDYFVEAVFGHVGGHALAAQCYPITYGVPDTSSPSLRVVDDLSAPNGRELCAGAFGPLAWAPDGDRLVGVAGGSASGYGPLCEIDARTGQVAALVPDGDRPLEGMSPQWGRGSRTIIYMRQIGDELTVWCYDRRLRTCRQLFPAAPPEAQVR